MVSARRMFLNVALALVIGALPGHISEEAKAGQANHYFSVDGLTLGMSLADYKKSYPAAEVTIHEASRYCFGRRVVLGELNWVSATGRRDGVSIQVIFHQLDQQFRLTELKRVEAIDPHETVWRGLRDRMVHHYGPYSRLLPRRKMEPAGRIVGFEWSHRDEQKLSVVVHEDQEGNSGLVFITTRLTADLPGLRTARSLAVRNRAAIESFRQECRMATNGTGDRGRSSR